MLQRNEVIDCLECDRLREAEEDESIKTRLDEHNARWDEELAAQLHVQPAKLSKKEKKKLRETKKLTKQKKMDADKVSGIFVYISQTAFNNFTLDAGRRRKRIKASADH